MCEIVVRRYSWGRYRKTWAKKYKKWDEGTRGSIWAPYGNAKEFNMEIEQCNIKTES